MIQEKKTKDDSRKGKIGLFIGRFQPFHLGHLSIIYEMAKKVDIVKIGVGSSQYSFSKENPFTFEERVLFLESAIDKNKVKKYEIYAVPDVHSYDEWVEHVIKTVGRFDVVYTGNQIVKELFEKKHYKVEDTTERIYISSTELRKMMFRDGPWKLYIPKGTVDILEKIQGVERIKDIFTNYKNPVPTVDAIIEYKNGIILIERRCEPFGWALPGGHVEYEESLEDAVVREAKEETGLERIEIVTQLHTYSDPKRDPRGHKISTVFVVKGYGTLNPATDAKTARVVTKDNMPKELLFDHNKIIEDYYKWKEKQYE